MTSAGAQLLRMLLAVGLALQLTALAALQAPASRADTPVSVLNEAYDPVVVVLDTSDSMSETDTKGTQRIVGARSAVLGLVDALPPRSQFALVAYPGAGAHEVNGCSEGNVEIKLGPLDQATAAAAVRRLTPSGDTPTEPALRHAARIIKNSSIQKGTIVLVSDGESNCGSTDVCEVAKHLAEQGVETRVNTVGFQISDDGAQELRCIAQATGGRYVDADDQQQLQDALQDLSGARLTLTAKVPDPLPVVSGTGAAGPKAVLEVTNVGRKPAQDVRLSLDLRDQANQPGAVLVPRPVRFLGNLEPGQSRTVDVTVRPDPSRMERFHWVASVTALNALPQRQEGDTNTAEPTLNGLLSGVKQPVVLGDSYSSGEGAGQYNGDGNKDNNCHRSDNAYGKVLSHDATIIACSGAVTANFYNEQVSGNRVAPQLKKVRALATSDKSPDAVLMSIGGNDVDFAGTVKACILGAPGQVCSWNLNPWDGKAAENAFRNDALKRVAAVADSLRRVYRDVNRAVNDPVALGKRGGKVAPIIVVPYPRIVPSAEAGASAAGGCEVNISADEISFFNGFIDSLNSQITAVVQASRNERVPIYVASDVVPAFQPNHTICDGSNSSANFTTDLRQASNSEMLHPNAAGNKAMARAISVWSASQTMMTDPAAVTWASIDAKKPAPALSLGGLSTAGGQTKATADGFDPESTVVFRLDSTPRILGSATYQSLGPLMSRFSCRSMCAPESTICTYSAWPEIRRCATSLSPSGWCRLNRSAPLPPS